MTEFNPEVVLSSLNPVFRQYLAGDAGNLAKVYSTPTVDIPHLLLVLIQKSVEFRQMLANLEVSPADIESAKVMLEHSLRNMREPDCEGLIYGSDVWNCLVTMYNLAKQYESQLPDGQASLALFPLALVQTRNEYLFVLSKLRLVPPSLELIKRWTKDWLRAENQDISADPIANVQLKAAAQELSKERNNEGHFARQFTIDMCQLHRDNKLFPVIGRENEIQQAINNLSRMMRNSVLMVGELGVGRKSVVHGVVSRIVNDSVPHTLQHVRVLKLDVPALKAGATSQGILEERLSGLLRELKAANNVVLYVEDAAILGDTVDYQNTVIAGMLLPVLTRGELRCIAVATIAEYSSKIENNATLAQLFSKIEIEAPSVPECVAILRGLKYRIESYHGISITDTALRSAVELSARYITTGNLPEKAISLLDTVAARLSTALTLKPDQILMVEQKLSQSKMALEGLKAEKGIEAEDERKSLSKEIEQLTAQLDQLNVQLESEKMALLDEKDLHRQLELATRELATAKEKGDISRTASLNYEVIPELQHKIQHNRNFRTSNRFQLINASVTDGEVSEMIAQITGIPASRMAQSERDRLLSMDNELSQEVVGQDQAIKALSDVVRRRRAGLNLSKGPIGSFLFLGPTGTGKTQLCKALARFLFDTEESMIRFDMGEFAEAHKVATLFGAPPGYVGYSEGGVLSNAVRSRPYSVVLFDEVEKAHPSIFNILLPILDEGYATDSQGRHVDFTNTIIIMTSNLGAHDILEMDGQPDSEIRECVMEHVRGHFRPELIARLNEVVVFNGLKVHHAHLIVNSFLKKVKQGLQAKRIGLTETKAAVERLVELGYDSANGARFIKNAVTRHIEDMLVMAFIKEELVPNKNYIVDVVDGNFVLKEKTEAPEAAEKAETPKSVKPRKTQNPSS